MARNLIIGMGVIAWVTFAVAAAALYLNGHWVAPTVTLIVGAFLMTVRLMQRTSPRRA
jgi:hypothetical protein